ncbi:hypothetical protein GGI04_003109 [Coemansia thaxteri]|nr:hypothetical protein GGI04_003109 [Coemansia thaxteri]
MEIANKLARLAAELELDHTWSEAAAAHRSAAQAYNHVESFDYDPVASVALSSLVHKHGRRSEYCERQSERQSSDTRSAGHAPSQTYDTDDNVNPPFAGQAPRAATNQSKHTQSDRSDREFEDFWQYMQSWLANPTAFTRPTIPSGSRAPEVGLTLGGQASGRSIMDSFYLVGPNPEQSASIYGLAAAPSRTATPVVATQLQVLNEADEDSEEVDGIARSEQGNSLPTTLSRQVPSEAFSGSQQQLLEAENHALRKQLVQLSERICVLESAAQENNMLKSSILNFREEFHRHANVVSLPRILEQNLGPQRGQITPADRVASSDDQVRQLESQLQLLQLENAKQVSKIVGHLAKCCGICGACPY